MVVLCDYCRCPTEVDDKKNFGLQWAEFEGKQRLGWRRQCFFCRGHFIVLYDDIQKELI